MSQSLENLQQDTYGESFSNLVNIYSENLNLSLSRTIISPSESDIDKFINSTLDKNEENKAIDFLFSVENNNNIDISIETIEDIVSYKTAIIESKFSKLNNKLNSYLSIKSNDEFLQETILKKIDNLNKVVELISVGITEKTSKVVANSFENILKKDIFSNQSKYFNKVSNYFFEKYTQIENGFNLNINSPDISIVEKNSTSQESFINADDNKLLEKSLIKIDRNYPFRFVKPIKNTSNDLVVQSIINSTRSLFSISPNCLLENYKDNEALKIDFDRFSLRNLITERTNFDFFNVLNIESNFVNSKMLITSEALENYNFLDFDYNEGLFFDSELQFFNVIDNQNIKAHSYSISSNSPISFIGFLAKVNEYYTNNIFNIDLTNFNNSFKHHYDNYYKYLVDIFNNDFRSSSNLEALELNQNLSEDFLVFNSPLTVFEFNTRKNNNFSKVYYKNKVYNEINYLESSSAQGGVAQGGSVTDRENIDIVRDVSTRSLPKSTFFADNETNINSLETKLKIDSLVKNLKNLYLSNNEVNIDSFKKVFKSIKKKTNNVKEEILSYTKKDRKNIAAINKDNKIFNILFTEEGGEIYSNTDVVANHIIDNEKYLGIDTLKKRNLNINPLRDDEKNNIKKIISFYYPQCSMFSSSAFFSKVMSDICNENDYNTEIENKNDILTSQALYLNAFKNNLIKEKYKKIVLRRFFKAALMKDKNTLQSIQESKPDDYLYNFEEYNLTDGRYNIESKESVEKYLDDILKSSENLENIKKSIFSTKNIKSLSNQCDYKLFKSFNIINNGRNRLITLNPDVIYQQVEGRDVQYFGIKDENKIFLTGKLFNTVFPFHMMEYSYIVGDVVKDKLQVKFDTIVKNKVNKDLINLNDPDNDYDDIFNYKPDKNGLDITSSDKIKMRIFPKFNDMPTLREKGAASNDNVKFPYFELEDYFDEAVENENMIFHNICKVVQDSIRLFSKEYNNIFFDSTEKIDNFINENEPFLFYIQQIIEIYASFYLPYFNRLQRKFSLENFKSRQTELYETNPVITNSVGQTSSEYLMNKYNTADTVQLNNFAELFNQEFNVNDISSNLESLQSNINGYITKENEIITLPCEDFRKYSYLNNNLKEDLISDIAVISDFIESPYTKFSHNIQNIAKSLYLSDVIQAFNLDILNGCIDYQEDIFAKTREQLSSSVAFNELSNILPSSEVEKIEDNFYDIFYINCLSKNLFKNIYINKKIEERVKEGIRQNQSFFRSPDIFKEIEEMEILDLSSTFNFDDSEEDVANYLTSSFYVFGLKKNQLSNIRYDSLIKITVNIVDKFNLNHVYVPKTFLFSPLYTNMTTLFPEDLNNISNVNSLGYFRLNNNINNRLGVVDSISLKESAEGAASGQIQFDFMQENIKNKFQTTDSQTVDIYKNLIDSQMISRKNIQLLKVLYSIENLNKKPVNNDNRITDNISSLSSKEFFNIFDIKKENSIVNGATSSKSLPEAIKNNDITYEFIKYLSSVANYEEIYGSEYYDIYSIAINPKNLYFFDLANRENITSFRESRQTHYVPTELENTNSFNFAEGKIFFKSKKKLENLNISMKVEII